LETTAPTYLEVLKKSEAYSDSPQKIKFEETQGSYLFHADAQLYKKSKKPGTNLPAWRSKRSSVVKNAAC